MIQLLEICKTLWNKLDLFGAHASWRDWSIVMYAVLDILLIVWWCIDAIISRFDISSRFLLAGKTQADHDTQEHTQSATYNDEITPSLALRRIVIIVTTVVLIMASSGTMEYKDIQRKIAIAEEYESDGEYMKAYKIYMEIYVERDDYQDISVRLKRCLDQIDDPLEE